MAKRRGAIGVLLLALALIAAACGGDAERSDAAIETDFDPALASQVEKEAHFYRVIGSDQETHYPKGQIARIVDNTCDNSIDDMIGLVTGLRNLSVIDGDDVEPVFQGREHLFATFCPDVLDVWLEAVERTSGGS